MTDISTSSQGKRRGRPPGSRNITTILREIAETKVTIRDADGRRTLTVLEAIILRLQHKAMRGDLRTDKRLADLRDRLRPRPRTRPGLLVVPGMMAEAEWKRRMEIVNQFKQAPPGLDEVIPKAQLPSQPVKPRNASHLPAPRSPLPPNPYRNRLIR